MTVQSEPTTHAVSTGGRPGATITVAHVRSVQARLARDEAADPTVEDVAEALQCEVGALFGLLAATSGARVARARSRHNDG
jgi:hypothetical protein